jgi:ribosomal protein S18 acetylase RimI-like enzyme
LLVPDTIHDRGPIVVTAAGSDDVDDVSTLFEAYRRFYQCSPDVAGSRRFVAELIDGQTTRFFVARLYEVTVGFVHLLPSFDTLAMRPSWTLEDLFVDPAYRRYGVGSALLRHAEDVARRTHAARLSLTTARTNATAQRLYIAHGYRPDDVFLAFYRILT